ncbi:MAG: FAD-binding oxidoreductase, partial [bacterium]|nr:FAD-binding oxidoreductase [bacterium]
MTFLELLSDIVGASNCSTHPDQLGVVAKDESTLAPVMPLAVVWPENRDQICRVVKLCADNRVPITTRGAGSALEGSTIPLENGIVLDLSRLTAIIEYWPEDLQVQVEPGLIYD